MATTTVNGVTAYTTSTSGTVTNYIPTWKLTPTEASFMASQDSAATTASTDLETQLKLAASVFTPSGQNAWDHFEGMVESYDTASDSVVINSADLAAAGSAYAQTEQQNVVDMVNALKHEVSKIAPQVDGSPV